MFKIVRTVKVNSNSEAVANGNREAIAIAEPKAPLTIPQRSLLCKLINSKSYDSKAVVMIKEDQDGEAVQVPLRFEDGTPVTFGHLADREDRFDAEGVKIGNHYPVVNSLTKGEANDIISDMITFGDRPKNPKGSYRGRSYQQNAAAKPQSVPAAKPQENIEALVAAAVAAALVQIGLIDEPAKPVQPEPAKPVQVPNGYTVTIGKNGRPYLKAIGA